MNTHVGQAIERVDRERETVETKRRAYGRFRSRVRSIQPRPGTTGAGEVVAGSAGGRVAEPILEAFDETVASVCEDRPTTELLAAELGEDVATALGAGGVSSPLLRAVLSESDRRRTELAAMGRALDEEADSLARTAETVERIRDWVIEANETPLSARGFEELRAYHERLAAFREDCAVLLSDRQGHLGRTTSVDGRAGLRHRDLVARLYEGFPIDHPVLVTLVRLDGLCTECQRSVRDHLVRRV